MDNKNIYIKKELKEKKQYTTKSSTIKYQILQEINANIQKYNKKRKVKRKNKRKNIKKLKKQSRYEKIKRFLSLEKEEQIDSNIKRS